MRKLFQYSIESYYLFKFDLSEDSAQETELPPDCKLVIFQEATPVMSALVDFWVRAYNDVSHVAEHKIKNLFQMGNATLTIMANDKVIGMVWLGGQSAICNIDFANILRHESSVCIIHHLFVDVAHRGKKLQNFLMNKAFVIARDESYTYLYGIVGANNIASVVNCMKTFKVFKVMLHLKIDIPFFVINLYPKSSSVAWRTTR